MPPLAEAHGGYTSCALFSHFLLRPLAGPSSASGAASPAHRPGRPPHVDPAACLRWAVYQQGAPLEAGGFRGRTNKLVDGCYGWWVGGLFAVLEGLVGGAEEQEGEKEGERAPPVEAETGDGEGDAAWEDVRHDMLFNRGGCDCVISFRTSCGRAPPSYSGAPRVRAHRRAKRKGRPARQAWKVGALVPGLSQPGLTHRLPSYRHPDLYHTCNNISGLSAAQHHVRHSRARVTENLARWQAPAPSPDGDTDAEERRSRVWAEALGWVEDEAAFLAVGGDENRVVRIRCVAMIGG